MTPTSGLRVLRAPHMDRCIGCHACSLACARIVHGLVGWDTCGIRIRSSGGLSTGFEARHCLACTPRSCAGACPTGAMAPRRDGGVVHKRTVCIRCGACAGACPVDAIHLSADKTPYVCIHCGQCVAFCPHGCIERTTGDVSDDTPDPLPTA